MAFAATFNGVSVPIAKDTIERLEDEVGGADVRAYAGNNRSTVRWQKKGWEFETPPITHAAAATILAQTGPGVTVTGPITNSVSTTCTVRCLNGPMPRSLPTATVKLVLRFRVRED